MNIIPRNTRLRFRCALALALAAVLLASPWPGAAESQGKYVFADADNLPIQKGMPDPFLMPGGKRVQTLEDWEEQRAYIKAMLAHYLYGTVPPRPEEIGNAG